MSTTARKIFKLILFPLLFFILAVGLLIAKPSQGVAKKEVPNYVPGEVILKFKSNVNIAQFLKEVESQIKEAKGEKVFKNKKTGDLSRVYKVKFDASQDINEVIAQYKKSPAIEYVEPNYIVRATTIPNDTLFSNQWGLHNTGQVVDGYAGTPDADIDAPEAWDIKKGSSSVVIAIIDTGVNYNHKDLSSKIWVNSDEIPSNSLDDDSNGFIDDYYGYDFVNFDKDPIDDQGHGTHVSGIAGAEANNNQGVAGISWNSKIMAVKVLDASGSGTDSMVANGIYYAVDNGANIINLSLGQTEDSITLHDAIEYAWDSGCLIVAAAGNLGAPFPNTPYDCYPACYNPGGGYGADVIAVAATDQDDKKASFSNYRTWVDVSAPGDSIWSTSLTNHPPYGYYWIGGGTSYASPFVGAQAALLYSHFPTWTQNQIINQIRNTTDNINSQNPSYVGKLGTGRINLYRSFLPSITSKIKLSSFSLSPSNPAIGEEVTANFSLKNEATADITLDSTGVAARYGGQVCNFPPATSVTITAGSTYNYSQKRIFTNSGTHRSWVYFYYGGIGYKVSSDKYFEVVPITSKVKLVSFFLSPSNPAMGEEVTATFSLKNEMVSSISLDSCGVAVRYGTYNRNFAPITAAEATIASGQTKQFVQKRTFDRQGWYNWWLYYYYNNTGYKLSSTKTFYYYPLTYKLKLISFSLSDYSPESGDTVTANFTLKNEAISDIALTSTGVAVRYDSAVLNFASISGAEAIIPAGQSKQFTSQKSFANIGTYKTWIYAYWGSYGFKLSPNKYFTIEALVTGWLYSSSSSFTNNLNTLDEIYPFWYETNSTATSYVKKSWVTIDPSLITTAHSHGIKVLPTITIGSGGATSIKNMITNPIYKGLLIANLLTLVQNNNYDGLDIDFEDFSGTLAPYRDDFSAFIEDLCTTFHANNKLVGFAAIAKPSEPGLWDSHKYTDWTRVGSVVDRFQIMLYNYTSQESSTPGPIAPYGWNNEVLNFAKGVIPSKKIFMGLGAWGWSWKKSGSNWLTPASYWSAEGASNYAETHGITPTYSSISIKSYYGDYYYSSGYAPRFNYSSGGYTHQVWYEDAKSSSQKIDLLKSKGIGGIAIWRIGAEDRHLWPVLESKL